MGVMQAANWRKQAGRIACLIVLGALLAGCDKCGDWWWGAQAMLSCKNTLPKNVLHDAQ